MATIRFAKDHDLFWQTLRQRVNAYFTENNYSRFSTPQMALKIGIMLALFIVPYIALGFLSNHLFFSWLCCFTMGLGMAGIGFNISHQAAHNALSRSKKINRLFSLSFNLVGMSDYIWKIKHNVFHHAYTNVFEKDEALKEGDVLRLSPSAPLKKMHRYQHVYGFFVYAFFTVFWAFVLDFEKYFRYKKMVNKTGKHPLKECILFFATKLYYCVVAFVVPVLCFNFTFSQTLLGFLTVHVVASLLITHVLQVEHLAVETIHNAPDNTGTIQKSWAQNQLEGTCNFKTRSKIFNWFIGGCNYQIEHHLFPGICAIHYPSLSSIVKSTTREFNFVYIQQPSFTHALVSHYAFLKQLGQHHG